MGRPFFSERPLPDIFGVVLPPGIMIGRHRSPIKASRVAPRIEHDALRKRLPAGGDHDAIMFPQRSRPRHGPMQLQTFELQRLQWHEEILGPLKA